MTVGALSMDSHTRRKHRRGLYRGSQWVPRPAIGIHKLQHLQEAK